MLILTLSLAMAMARLPMQHREYEALHHTRQLDPGLLRHILRPQLMEEIGRRFEDPVRVNIVRVLVLSWLFSF